VKRAFSLIELITVIGIIVVVSALLWPVLANARRASQISSTTQRLRQLHLAVKLYQAEYHGDGSYGTPEQMGLPTWSLALTAHLGVNQAMLASPCGCHPDFRCGSRGRYQEMWPLLSWNENIAFFEDNMPLIADLNCNDVSVRMENQFVSRRGVAVLLSGTIVNRYSPGIMYDPYFYSEPVN
jgi:prepilin-type N-terminal cleavage/methylation domain-containing protein